MRSFGIVVSSPMLNQDLRLFQSVEDLHVQALITQFSIEALAITVLPR